MPPPAKNEYDLASGLDETAQKRLRRQIRMQILNDRRNKKGSSSVMIAPAFSQSTVSSSVANDPSASARVLKNRQSAERSRLKKDGLIKSLSDKLSKYKLIYKELSLLQNGGNSDQEFGHTQQLPSSLTSDYSSDNDSLSTCSTLSSFRSGASKRKRSNSFSDSDEEFCVQGTSPQGVKRASNDISMYSSFEYLSSLFKYDSSLFVEDSRDTLLLSDVECQALML